jgi:hypothetical protein
MMIKRYGFGLFGEFNEQLEGVFVRYTDYAHLEAAFSRWKAQSSKDCAQRASLRFLRRDLSDIAKWDALGTPTEAGAIARSALAKIDDLLKKE